MNRHYKSQQVQETINYKCPKFRNYVARGCLKNCL